MKDERRGEMDKKKRVQHGPVKSSDWAPARKRNGGTIWCKRRRAKDEKKFLTNARKGGKYPFSVN